MHAPMMEHSHAYHFHPGMPLVIAGYFNATLSEDDVGDAEFMASPSITPEERESTRTTMQNGKGGGFVNSFRHLHPEATGCYTWWGDLSTSDDESISESSQIS